MFLNRNKGKGEPGNLFSNPGVAFMNSVSGLCCEEPYQLSCSSGYGSLKQPSISDIGSDPKGRVHSVIATPRIALYFRCRSPAQPPV